MTTYAFQIDLLGAAVSPGGTLDGAKVMLFVNTPAESKATVVADLTEPTFMGYTAGGTAVAAWSAPYVDGADDSVKVDGGDVLFQATGGAPDDLIQGWALVDSTGALLIKAEYLSEPVGINDLIHGVLVDVVYVYGE